MLSTAWISALISILFWLFFLGGLYVYTALARQISARLPAFDDETASLKTFGLPEAIVAVVLISFLLLNVMVAISACRLYEPTEFDALGTAILGGYGHLVPPSNVHWLPARGEDSYRSG